MTFPILAAGLFSSFLFAFATSFDELTIALFASRRPAPRRCPSSSGTRSRCRSRPVIAAVSTCLFLFLALLIWIADRLRRRSLAH